MQRIAEGKLYTLKHSQDGYSAGTEVLVMKVHDQTYVTVAPTEPHIIDGKEWKPRFYAKESNLERK